MNEQTRLHASTFAFILRNADMNISNITQIIHMIWRFFLYILVCLLKCFHSFWIHATTLMQLSLVAQKHLRNMCVTENCIRTGKKCGLYYLLTFNSFELVNV